MALPSRSHAPSFYASIQTWVFVLHNCWIMGGCWDRCLHSKSWTRQSHAHGFSRTRLDITKGALNAPGQLQTICGHRKHMLAHGLTGLYIPIFIEQYDYTPMANLWTTSLHEVNYCMIGLFQSCVFTYNPYHLLVICTHPHFTLMHTPSWGLGYAWSHRTIFVSGYTE